MMASVNLCSPSTTKKFNKPKVILLIFPETKPELQLCSGQLILTARLRLPSIIAPTSWAGNDIFDYLNSLQSEQEKLAPENYPLWYYK